ncbi:unnamed protein product, partial [marine sediment metagenome]
MSCIGSVLTMALACFSAASCWDVPSTVAVLGSVVGAAANVVVAEDDAFSR